MANEVARLNLGGSYDPHKEVDRESYSDKVRKNSQMRLQEASAKFQRQAQVMALDQAQSKLRSSKYLAKNYNKFTKSSASIKNPDSWLTLNPQHRKNAIEDWDNNVGGDYASFNPAYASGQAAEQSALKRSLESWSAEYAADDKDEFKKEFSGWFDELGEKTQNLLKSNASPDLYQMLVSNYQREEDRSKSLLDYAPAALGTVLGASTVYKGVKGVKNFFGKDSSKELANTARENITDTSVAKNGVKVKVKGQGKAIAKGKYRGLSLKDLMNKADRVGGTADKNFVNTVRDRFNKAWGGTGGKGFMKRLIKASNNQAVKKKLAGVAAKGVVKAGAAGSTGVGLGVSLIFSALTLKEVYDLYNSPEIQDMLDG